MTTKTKEVIKGTAQEMVIMKDKAHDFAETISDHVEDKIQRTLQKEREKYIKYKASVNTSIFWAKAAGFWSKRASKIARDIAIATGIIGGTVVTILLIRRWMKSQHLSHNRRLKRKERDVDIDNLRDIVSNSLHKKVNTFSHGLQICYIVGGGQVPNNVLPHPLSMHLQFVVITIQ